MDLIKAAGSNINFSQDVRGHAEDCQQRREFVPEKQLEKESKNCPSNEELSKSWNNEFEPEFPNIREKVL